MRIQINESVHDKAAMSDLLHHICCQLENGYSCGYYPHWELIPEEDDAEYEEE